MTQANLRELIGWTWRESRGYRGRIVGTCVLNILRVGLGLVGVWVSKTLIDHATESAPGEGLSTLVWLCVLLAVLFLAEAACSLMGNYIANLAETVMTNDMRLRTFRALMLTERPQTDTLHSGDIVNRVTEDVAKIGSAVAGTIPSAVVMAVQLAASFAFLCVLSPGLAVCSLLILPAFLLISRVFLRRVRTITAEIRADDSAIQSTIQEGLQHRLVVKTLECVNTLAERLASGMQSKYSRTLSRQRVSLTGRSIMRVGFIAAYLTAFFWGVFNLYTGAITFGIMTAFLQLVGRIQGPIASLAQTLPGLVPAATAVDRLREIADPEAAETNPQFVTPAPAGVNIQDVSFSYTDDKGECTVFSDFSHDFRPGTITAVMGPTGVGKTTLFRLILALLKPDKGSVSIYSPTMSLPADAATRCNIAYVPQGNSLFDGTVRDNLLMGDPAASEARMHEVLHTAVADFVYDLADGLDTRIGEGGARLSEGQAQRIAIARGLLRPGSILLLDEFNSSLDPDTASTLMQRLLDTHTTHTIILISHRPEVERWCTNTLRLS